MKLTSLLVGLALTAATQTAHAQGFQLQQYEPVAAAERGFVSPAPWYAPERAFAAGLTLDYGHDVLQGGRIDADGFSGETIVEHQLAAHVDVAYSPWDRLSLSLSLPVTLWEDGAPRLNVEPASGVALGDPRIGAAVRVFGDAAKDPVSLHALGALWIPIGAEEDHAGDEKVRGRLGAALAGQPLANLTWGSSIAVLLRDQAGLNDLDTGPGTVGNELQATASIGYSSDDRSLHAGPELAFGTVLDDGRAFKEDGSHLEAFFAGSYWVASAWQLGAALGVGIVRTPGTPDARGLLRVAYSPATSAEPQPAPPTHAPAPPPAAPPAVVEPAPAPEPAAVAAAVEPAPPPEEPAVAPEPVVPVEPAPPPALADLPSIQFARNEATTTDTSSLQRAAEILAAHPEVAKIRVDGHSDDTGQADFNQRLSLARARFVADQLVQHGVPRAKLQVRGMGSTRPLSAGADEASRSANRRVELIPQLK